MPAVITNTKATTKRTYFSSIMKAKVEDQQWNTSCRFWDTLRDGGGTPNGWSRPSSLSNFAKIRRYSGCRWASQSFGGISWRTRFLSSDLYNATIRDSASSRTYAKKENEALQSESQTQLSNINYTFVKNVRNRMYAKVHDKHLPHLTCVQEPEW